MPAANIVINDAQATPVPHTFIPIGRDPDGTFWFEDQSASNSVGFWRISVKTKRPTQAKAGQSAQDRTFRTTIGLHEPILETVSNDSQGYIPAPTVAYVSRSILEVIDPERSNLDNRKDMTKMLPLLIQNSQIVDILNNHTELSY